MEELKDSGMRLSFMGPDGMGHALDINLQQGEEMWDRCVEPE